jgi:hypothetical protein
MEDQIHKLKQVLMSGNQEVLKVQVAMVIKQSAKVEKM